MAGGVWLLAAPTHPCGFDPCGTGFCCFPPRGFIPPAQFLIQRSDFSPAKIQGTFGVALGPCVLFLALVCYLVGGLAVAGVGGCGCRRVRLFLVSVVGEGLKVSACCRFDSDKDEVLLPCTYAQSDDHLVHTFLTTLVQVALSGPSVTDCCCYILSFL